MTSAPGEGGARAHRARCALVALVSLAALGYELSLLRLLHLASWHHLAFLVVSLALLGGGAAGTLLGLRRVDLLAESRPSLLPWLALLAGASMPLATTAALRLPVEGRVVPSLLVWQLGSALAALALLGAPFLLAGLVVGVALAQAGASRVGAVYAASLAGSGVGAVLAVPVLQVLPPSLAPTLFGGVAVASLLVPGGPGGARRAALALGTLAAVALVHRLVPPVVRPDSAKAARHVEELVRQGSAHRLAARTGARGAFEVFRSETFHDLPFHGGPVPPPAVDLLLHDGHRLASLLRVRCPEDAPVMDQVLPAAAYDLVSVRPRVLLLGEIGGSNAWLALRRGAAAVHVVQPFPEVQELLEGPLRAACGAFLERREVEATVAYARAYLDHTSTCFDLIQLAALEGLPAGGGGMLGLSEDALATVEGFDACLAHLSPGGVVAVARGIQTPARDNLKILATFAEALRRRDVGDLGSRVVIVRDWLAVLTLVRVEPWTELDIVRVREVCRARRLTPVWFPAIRAEETNRPDELPGPPGAPWDWYHEAARAFSTGEGEAFVRGYAFDLRPPTDDRPFFHDFCRVFSLGALADACGPMFVTRVEAGFLVVLATLVLALAFGAVVGLVPLARLSAVPGRLATGLVFTGLGLGYLFLEMALLSRTTLVLGDPLWAATVTIGGCLVCSGLGSVLASRPSVARLVPAQRLFPVLAAVALGHGTLIEMLPRHVADLSLGTKIAVVCVLQAPLAVLLGMPFPLGLARLHRAGGRLVPWGYGVNGFASVVAPPLAVALAMTWGYRVVVAVAALAYLGVGWCWRALPTGSTDR